MLPSKKIQRNLLGTTCAGSRGRRKAKATNQLPDFDKAIQLDATYFTAYLNRGDAWFNKGQYDKAGSDYSAAIRLNPKAYKPYVGRGAVFATKGRYDEAIRDFRKGIELMLFVSNFTPPHDTSTTPSNWTELSKVSGSPTAENSLPP